MTNDELISKIQRQVIKARDTDGNGSMIGLTFEEAERLCDIASEKNDPLEAELEALRYDCARWKRKWGEERKQGMNAMRLHYDSYQDLQDLHMTRKTIFYRCKCGRMREEGVACVNKECSHGDG
jgi:hypothetical protein